MNVEQADAWTIRGVVHCGFLTVLWCSWHGENFLSDSGELFIWMLALIVQWNLIILYVFYMYNINYRKY